MSQAEAKPTAAAAASSAAAAFLTSIGGRFASGGVIEPEPEGMQKPAGMPAASAQVDYPLAHSMHALFHPVRRMCRMRSNDWLWGG